MTGHQPAMFIFRNSAALARMPFSFLDRLLLSGFPPDLFISSYLPLSFAWVFNPQPLTTPMPAIASSCFQLRLTDCHPHHTLEDANSDEDYFVRLYRECVSKPHG